MGRAGSSAGGAEGLGGPGARTVAGIRGKTVGSPGLQRAGVALIRPCTELAPELWYAVERARGGPELLGGCQPGSELGFQGAGFRAELE